MLKIIRHLTPFLSIQILFLITISIISLNYNKFEAHLWINQYHYTFLDYVFYLLTHSVEFWSSVIIFLFIGFVKNYKLAAIGFAGFLMSGLVTQILKRFFFTHHHRPTYYLNQLRLLPDNFGFEQHAHYSFPSGHSTAAFSLCLFLALISKTKKWGYFFGVLACLIAFSRVYLSQHFFIDIAFGSMIGSGVTILVFYFLNKYWLKSSL
jgi:membrane-associated phospholipid phosphatase